MPDRRTVFSYSASLSPFPEGWYFIATIQEIRKIGLIHKTWMGERIVVWCDVRIRPDKQLIVIVRDDDTTFSIVHSRFHEVWSLRLGTSLEDRPRYTPSTTTFKTFPFPPRLTPDIPCQRVCLRPACCGCRPDHHTRRATVVRRRPEVSVNNCRIGAYYTLTGFTRAGSVLYDPPVSSIQ